MREGKCVTIGILNGGKSRRFGSDKGEAVLEDKTFLAHLLSAFAENDDILVSIGKVSPLPSVPCRVVRDEREDYGPVEGLRRILEEAKHELVFLLPVDMPLLAPPFLKALLSALDDETDIVLPLIEGRETPLPGLYRKSLLPLLEEEVEKGNHRMMEVVRKARWKTLPVDALSQEDGVLFNVNDQETFRLLQTKRAGREE